MKAGTLLVNQDLWWRRDTISNRRMGIWGAILVGLEKEAPQLIKAEGDMARVHLFISPSLSRCSQQSEFRGECSNGSRAGEFSMHILQKSIHCELFIWEKRKGQGIRE